MQHYYFLQLDAHEKSWIIRSAQGDLVEMQILLNADEELAYKKVSAK